MKLNKSQLSIGILFLSLSVVGILFAFTKLSPSSSPTPTFHSLNEIYSLITTGTSTPHSSLSTSSSPSATTSHSTTEIYLLLANKFKQENLRPGANIFGITGTYGTPDTNYVLATSSAVSSLTPTYTTTDLSSYTLEDIYNLINDTGTRITEPNHTFSSSPSASMHTTTEIYDRLASLKPVLTATRFGTTTSMFGITGTFSPTAQVSQSCGSGEDCFSGYCGYDQDWNQACINGITGVDYCYDGFSCTTGYCDMNYSVCSDGGVGSGCYDKSQCSTGWCDTGSYGVCTTGEIGSTCAYSYDCATGHCDSANSYTCTDGSAGSGCSDDSGCAQGLFCAFDSNNRVGSCGTGELGSTCYSNSNCGEPNVCDMGTNTCVDGSVGASCTSGSGCSSGYCNTIGGICSSGIPGSACGGNSECDIYNCVSNVCSADLPPLTSGLVGYWPFNETSGTVAHDLSGGGHNGTLTGGVSINQIGKIGKAFGLNGTNSYVTLNQVPVQSNISVFIWAKSDTSLWNEHGWLASSRSANGFIIHPGANTKTTDYYLMDSNGSNAWVGTCDPSSITQWGLYGFSYNALSGRGTFICDGVLTAFSASVPRSSGMIDVCVGLDCGDGSRYGKGFVDEPAIWNRALAPAEIMNLYNNGAGMSIITP